MTFPTFIAQAPPPDLPDIEEIEIPDALPDPWKVYIWIGIGLLVLVGVVAVVITLVMFLMREKKRVLTAEYVAARRLEEIESRANEMTPNEYSIQVSDALKDFVQSRFKDPVRFETTDEFLYRITAVDAGLITPQVRDELAEFLHIAEEIKFGLPPDAEASKIPLLRKAQSIVEIQRQTMQAAAERSRK